MWMWLHQRDRDIKYCLLPCCSLLIRFSTKSAHPSNYLSTCRPLYIATPLYCYSLQGTQTWHADLCPLKTFQAKLFLPIVFRVIECHCFYGTHHCIVRKEDNGHLFLSGLITPTIASKKTKGTSPTETSIKHHWTLRQSISRTLGLIYNHTLRVSSKISKTQRGLTWIFVKL